MTTIELKKVIFTFLKTVADNVYDAQAPQEIRYPYVVYSLDSSRVDDNEKMTVFELTIDVFDNDKLNTTALDTITGSIDGDGAITGASGLHRKHYSSTAVQTDIYRSDWGNVEEKDKNVNHVEIVYEIYAYLK